MNGIESRPDKTTIKTGIKPLLPGEQKKRNRQKQHLKLIVCLILTNCLLFFLFISPEKAQTKIKKSRRILHPGYVILNLPLKTFVSIKSDDSVIPVSLYSSNNRIIIKKAYLHIDHSDKDKKHSSFDDQSNEYHEVEIPNDKIEKIINTNGELLLAYPGTETKIETKTNEQYEIIF